MKIGIEAEGRFKGINTLLVPRAEIERALRYLSARHEIYHVYIGAFGKFIDCHEDIDEINQLRKMLPQMPITIEIDLNSAGLLTNEIIQDSRVRLVLSIRFDSLSLNSILDRAEVKLDTPNRAYIYSQHESIDTTYCYDKDV